MANPKDDPVAFVQQCVMNPENPTFQGDAVDAIQALDTETHRLKLRIKKLQQARETIADRFSL